MAEKKHTRARRNTLETMPNELLLGAFYTSLRTWHVFESGGERVCVAKYGTGSSLGPRTRTDDGALAKRSFIILYLLISH